MKILPPVSIEARRLLPSRWDLLAAVMVLGFIVAFADASRLLVQPLASTNTPINAARKCLLFIVNTSQN